MESSCKNCEKRQLGCHSVCESYIAFRKQREEVYAKRLSRQKTRDYTCDKNYKLYKNWAKCSGKRY